MSNEPNKPIEAEELTDKELEGIVGGLTKLKIEASMVEDRAKKVKYRGFLASWGVQVGK